MAPVNETLNKLGLAPSPLICDLKVDSLNNIKKILSENKKILGYGAPAKATTILNYFGLNENYFKYVIDDSEIKHGKYIPETNIQIISKDDVDTEDYEFVLVLVSLPILLLGWSVFSDDPEIRNKLDLFFEYFKNLPYWYQAIFIGVVSAIYGLKGADIMRKE